MLETAFFTVLAMSLTGSALWLFLRLTRPLTARLCSARWERGSRLAVLLTYLVPVGLLLTPLFSPTPALTLPAVLSPYGTAVSLPPAWALLYQDSVSSPPSPLPAVGAALWLAGALASAAALALRQRRFLQRLRTTALPCEEAGILALLERLSGELELPAPALFTSGRVRTPLGAGLLRPALYLPEADFEAEELELIFRHELIHLRWRDLWLKWAALLALTLHWFDPCAWRFVREWGLLCETACDEAVVGNLPAEGRRRYGHAILDVLCRAAPETRGVCSSLCSGPWGLKLRLRRILRPRPGRVGQALCTCAIALLLCAFLPLASSLHAWAEPYRGWGNAGDYEANLARTALQYLPYGVTYDAVADRFFYQGEALSAFTDFVPATEAQRAVFPDFTMIWRCAWYDLSSLDAPAYQAMRDGEGRLTGVTPMPPEAVAEFLDNSKTSVCFNSYYTTGADALFASDPRWETLPQSIQDWALSVPAGETAALEQGAEGYLCYGGTHCPWQLKLTDSGALEVYFYPIQGSDHTRPGVLRYTAQTPPSAIEFYVEREKPACDESEEPS